MSDLCESAELTPRVARFAVLDSPVHGLGVFAMRRLMAGERIVEYTGERITKTESQIQCAAGNHYIFALDDAWDLDGDRPDNPARFINHSCAPNCEAIQRDSRIWLEALREIRPGEELSFDYGYDLENYREHPCHCGAVGCCGYVVAEQFRDEVRKRESRPTQIEEEERTG
jgi:SET domain-containing protein